MSPRKITVTIEGPQGAGKTRLADLLHDALLNAGAFVADQSIPDRPLWNHFGANIHIVEKQVN